MPEFFPDLPGQFCAGNAGDGGVVSTNGGRVVIGPNAGNAHVYQVAEFACQQYAGAQAPHLVAVNVLTGASRELLAGGVNKIVAGGGHWFAASIPFGPMLDGMPVGYNVRAFAGPYMAWFPWNGTGLILRGPGGDRTLSTVLGPEDRIKLFPDGSCAWPEAGQIKIYDWNANTIIGVNVVSGGFGWAAPFRIGGSWWVAYQSYALAAVVVHPATELRGYRWWAPWAYRLDSTVIGNTEPWLVWSRGDADSPADIQHEHVDLSLPRVDLAVPAPVPVPVPTPVPPKPEPKPVPLKTVPMPARIPAIVQALYAQHVDLANGDDDQRRALQILVCEQARFELGGAYGAKKAGEGHPASKDSIAYLASDGVLYAADCFNGSTRKPAVPSALEEIPGQVFIPVQSVDHLGATGNPTQPAPDPDGMGKYGDFSAAAKGLEEVMRGLASMSFQQGVEINALKAKIAALEARPAGGNVTGIADGAIVALRSHTNDVYVTAEPDGIVHAAQALKDRPFGEYQLFTIEVQQ